MSTDLVHELTTQEEVDFYLGLATEYSQKLKEISDELIERLLSEPSKLIEITLAQTILKYQKMESLYADLVSHCATIIHMKNFKNHHEEYLFTLKSTELESLYLSNKILFEYAITAMNKRIQPIIEQMTTTVYS